MNQFNASRFLDFVNAALHVEILLGHVVVLAFQNLLERADGFRGAGRQGFFVPRVYNSVMARGWESKSVEEQQSAASRQVESKQRLTPQEAAQRQEREAIELSRRRVLQQLQAVQNPRHRQMLENALSELNERLARRG